MLEFFSATSNTVNSKRAITECLENAIAGQSGLDCDLVIIYTNMGHNLTDLITEAKRLTNGATVVGGSFGGVIGMEGPDESPWALGIMAVKGPRDEFAVAGLDSMLDKDIYTGYAKLAEDLKKQNKRINMIHFLPSAFDIVPLNRTIEGIESVFGPDVPITGGGAVSSVKSTDAFLFLDGEIFDRGAVAIGFADPTLKYHIGVSHGLYVIGGTTFEVTRSEGNRIYELNGQSAWKFYCEKLEVPESTPVMEASVIVPLAVELPEDLQANFADHHQIFCCIEKEEDGSLYYPQEIKEGTKVWWCRRDDKRVFKATDHLGERVKNELEGNRPLAVFHVECRTRGSWFFNQSQKEGLINYLQHPVCGKEKIPWLGCYAGGEFGPIGNKNMGHQFSAVLCVITRTKD